MGWFERPEFGANVGLIDEIYRQYLDNPESVSPGLARLLRRERA